jgi:hypothetical protein
MSTASHANSARLGHLSAESNSCLLGEPVLFQSARICIWSRNLRFGILVHCLIELAPSLGHAAELARPVGWELVSAQSGENN